MEILYTNASTRCLPVGESERKVLDCTLPEESVENHYRKMVVIQATVCHFHDYFKECECLQFAPTAKKLLETITSSKDAIRFEAIASKLEAITTSSNKLLGAWAPQLWLTSTQKSLGGTNRVKGPREKRHRRSLSTRIRVIPTLRSYPRSRT